MPYATYNKDSSCSSSSVSLYYVSLAAMLHTAFVCAMSLQDKLYEQLHRIYN